MMKDFVIFFSVTFTKRVSSRNFIYFLETSYKDNLVYTRAIKSKKNQTKQMEC